MTTEVQSVIVVGGGTSGWLSALHLARRLGADAVTVVESKTIGTIGVGESTIPHIRRTLLALDIDEDEFMIAADATFKVGARFDGWGASGTRFWSPFAPFPSGLSLQHALRHFVGSELGANEAIFGRELFPAIAVGSALRAPRVGTEKPYSGQVHYSYHIDSAKLGAYLSDLAQKRGIRRIEDTVVNVTRDDRGFIHSLVTASGCALHADFFIDCSGFAGLLINKALNEPFIRYDKWLPTDRALAFRIPFPENHKDHEPFTTATALSSGWAWRVPLYSRLGAGYVYASNFQSDDDAEREAAIHFQTPHCKDVSIARLKMRVGRTRRAWVGNCVSIGLSAGFVEPLEATAIYMAELGLALLDVYFPATIFDAVLIAKYNQSIQEAFEEIRDFIILHYCTSPRRDSEFWRCVSSASLPDRVQETLALWDALDFRSSDLLAAPDLFAGRYLGQYFVPCILLGVGRAPRRLKQLMHAPPTNSGSAPLDLVGRIIEKLPAHSDYLKSLNNGQLSQLASIFRPRSA